ncbi:hypothetical protein [Natranaerobius trueperi]|uniref:Uncharacterized protein n=1 Tax=Natranaerobius trueperi TaxID=759412 RepID=A0A226BZB5_9FIRM|nr:hypothetical protein [Natranaerobius trueperi]OWZ84373.1 hypothetical protein CDO51_03680 [Natranaerobius trueperi]
MFDKAFTNLYWGFLFVSLDFRINGVTLLPDIIGYILFAVALSSLASHSKYWDKAKNFNLPMIFVSLFTIYEPQNHGGGLNVQFNLIELLAIILSLFVVYHIFMGIKEVGDSKEQYEISEEAQQKWYYFLGVKIASLVGFVFLVVPSIAVVYVIAVLIANITITLLIMGFISKCQLSLK